MAAQAPCPATATAATQVDEIDLDTLRRLRLLLDRALQPVAEFKGFEWRDQFQTAAIRYQINFLSYALSMAQHRYLPAMSGYYLEAQRRLLAKQGDPRIWRYWAFENAWGNLRLGRDPIPRGNIMYSGFVATQMALAAIPDDLRLVARQREWNRYGLADMTAHLAAQYRAAPYGLLACEPNWIYPLCNMISATAIRANDARAGGKAWDTIAQRFRDGLTSEFMTADGRFIAFRSSLTGFAPPSVGGAVMQTFPCLFLNSLFPDMAAAQWRRFRADLQGRDWRRAFWPVDVGNYSFSRASSYAASAAAAVELGDEVMAARLLSLLDKECPSQVADGVVHRSRASLWAHAVELMARLGGAHGLRGMIDNARPNPLDGPHLEDAPYPAVLVAQARRVGTDALSLVIHPGGQGGDVSLTIAGLSPGKRYRITVADPLTIDADDSGRACLTLALHGRVAIHIAPAS